MAPLPTIDYTLIPDLSISSLELDRRSSPADLPTDLSSLFLSDRESLQPSSSILKRSTTTLDISPHEPNHLLYKKSASPLTTFDPSAGSIPPTAINNKSVLFLFALLSVGLVLSSIWFFFWAKNGGCVFRRGDWAEYKSTVLRRKGPNGTTLSGATKTTDLGGGSIVSHSSTPSEISFAKTAPPPKGRQSRANKKRTAKKAPDPDVRAYRHERPARVGGLNRAPDATYTDCSATDPSAPYTDYSATATEPSEHAYNPHTPPPHPKKAPAAATPKPRHPSYTPNSESAFSVASNDSQRPLRPSNHSPTRHQPHAHSQHNNNHARQSTHSTPTRSRQSSPTKHGRSGTAARGRGSGGYTEPIDFSSRYAGSEAETEERPIKAALLIDTSNKREADPLYLTRMALPFIQHRGVLL
ncbi:hypothetical protein LPUS_12614 [Lasallia pustulata]|uniref:Uncharacterized protein n=1 Tax=Lasallia pustulata TaxID=136370 RepID=A0A1W5DED7_9LECA|nr:hypothetical protein LPUS_12614 [Lasallia pustulata]